MIYNPQASGDAEETVFRILLFKFFNRISTWELLKSQFGMPTWKDFDEPAYVRVLDGTVAKDNKIFSAAYTHNDLPCYEKVSPEKHPRYLRLLKEMMGADVTRKLQAVPSYREAFGVLNAFPLRSDFIGMQHLTDINEFALKDNERIKQTLKLTGPLPAPFFPPKWGIKAIL